MLQNFKIGTRIGFGSTLIMVVALAVITPRMLSNVGEIVDEAENRELSSHYQTLLSNIQAEARLAEAVAAQLAQIPDVQRALAENDRDRLHQLLVPGFTVMREQYAVRQMQVHTPPAVSFLRVHNPSKYGDDLSGFRATVVETNGSRTPITGIERGVAGLGIRGVVPIFHEGRHHGSVELGMSFGPAFFAGFKERYGVDAALHLRDGDGFRTFASTVGDKPLLTPAELTQALEGQAVIREVELAEHPVSVYGNVITDYSGKPIGVVEIASDRSYYAATSALARNETLIVGVIALLLGGVVSLFISRSITGPIRRAVLTMEDIAQGEGDLTRSLNVTGRDELAQMARAFNQFAAKIRELVREVADASIQLQAASGQMAVVTAETDQGVRRQQAETQQVATAVHEMAATVQEIAGSANGAAQAAHTANEQSANGRLVVQRAVKGIQGLAAEVEQAAQAVRHLEEDSENIGSVLDVIRGVSEQTNLLALNAAIEAARAGEQGRGFTVVADEVRVLAQRVQNSTAEIESMIARLQQAARDTGQVMERGRRSAQESVEQARETDTALQTVNQAVAVITDMNTRIASAVEEQSAVAEEINRNIATIGEIAETSAKGSRETASAGMDIHRLADSLEHLVRRFKV